MKLRLDDPPGAGAVSAAPAAGATTPAELTAAQLARPCDLATLTFETTADLHLPARAIGQDRAIDAIEFGIGIRREGYNLFALGPPGVGRHTIVRTFLERQAAREPQPPDWCYVHNFETPSRPKALALPPGRGARLRDDMARLLENVRSAIVAALESEDYRVRRKDAEEQIEKRQEQAFSELREAGVAVGIAVVVGPTGLVLAPLKDGAPMEAEAFAALPPDEQARLRTAMKDIEDRFEKMVRQFPAWRREMLDTVRELQRVVTSRAVDGLIAELKQAYADVDGVVAYLSAVQQDMIDNEEHFHPAKDAAQPMIAVVPWTRRYQVNVLSHPRAVGGAPVEWEDTPTYQNLVGRIEHESQLGVLVTDFTLIRPGALHRANNGYLILDAHRVLTEPFAWESLKRALRAGQIRTESLAHAVGFLTTVSLEPEPIPLNLKVVLVGDRYLYYLLHHFDPEFSELFKVAADFADSTPRRVTSPGAFADFVGEVARHHSLRPLARAAVARVIDHTARLSGDAARLSLNIRTIAELLCEADYWAAAAGRRVIEVEDIQHAIDAQRRRADRVHERWLEEIQRGTIAIATDGSRVGQVNGVSVIELGGVAFAHPSRITARVRLGAGTVLDIEREVELGGPTHSKGVLILAGFLSGRFVTNLPLSLAASLVFEQSYGPVEGDSASAAELFALLSALAEAPVRQSLAVTGSIDQHGNMQAIGAVNEKIEGFFEVCSERGLTGKEGVIIPAANVQHLMLRQDVVDAVAAGLFHVYAIGTIDEGLPILTGLSAGTRDEDGAFTPGSVNARVEARLAGFARQARAFRTAVPTEAQPTSDRP